MVGKELGEIGRVGRIRGVVAQESGPLVWIPAVEGEAQRSVHLVDGAHTFKGFGFSLSREFQKKMLHVGVVEHVLSENGVELLRGYERGKDDVGKEAFGTLAAPDVLFAAGIAAAENAEVLAVAAEEHGNLQFGERAEKTEIVIGWGDELRHILAEIVLELEAFGVLVVDACTHNG